MDLRSPVLKCVPFLSPDVKTHSLKSKTPVTKRAQIIQSTDLTQSGASEAGLHGVAVFDAEFPHGDPTGSLFALLDTELAALKGELTDTVALTLPALQRRISKLLHTLSNTRLKWERLPYCWHFCSSSVERLVLGASAQRRPQCCNRT